MFNIYFSSKKRIKGKQFLNNCNGDIDFNFVNVTYKQFGKEEFWINSPFRTKKPFEIHEDSR